MYYKIDLFTGYANKMIYSNYIFCVDDTDIVYFNLVKQRASEHFFSHLKI